MFVDGVEREYKEFKASVEFVFGEGNATPSERAAKSIAIAKRYNIPESRIMHSVAELDAWIRG